MSKKVDPSEKSNEDLYDKNAFDHIKKKVDGKKTQSTASMSTGISTPMKVFFLGLIIFSGLLFSGVLTGVDSPFGTFGENQDNGNQDNTQFSDNELTNMCVQHDSISTHDHYYLSIFIDGSQQIIPANIGIPSSNCYRPIHTHDASGKVHVELPSDYTGDSPTLGDFFDIWGKSLGNDTLLGNTGEVTLIVGGSEDTRQNPRTLSPADEQSIELRINTSG